MKKKYLKPTLKVVKVRKYQLLVGSLTVKRMKIDNTHEVEDYNELE